MGVKHSPLRLCLALSALLLLATLPVPASAVTDQTDDGEMPSQRRLLLPLALPWNWSALEHGRLAAALLLAPCPPSLCARPPLPTRCCPPSPCLCPAARVLLEWKRGSFAARGRVAGRLRSWAGGLPCDEAWFGVGCSELAGGPRVTSIDLNTTQLGGSLTLKLSSGLAALPLVTL